MSLEKSVDSVYRRTLKSINGTIEVLSKLERDPPITVVANMEMNGELALLIDREIGRDILALMGKVNEYRSSYWKLENRIKQGFISLLKKAGYLPSSSPEVVSLKNALPMELIKGDGKLWIFSYDYYIENISSRVGRSREKAPKGKEVWAAMEADYGRSIDELEKQVNELLPLLHITKAKLLRMLKGGQIPWKEIKIKNPKVSLVKRPVKKIIIVKRPIPLPRKPRRPRKKILKRPELRVIGPEGRKK
ncbi:MAG: hypothetical protein ACMUIE_08015 [Thermoplasmatota archaeon]